MIYKNNANQEFIVLQEFNERVKNRLWPFWLIQFVNTGTTKKVYRCNALAGKALDPYAPSNLGVGYMGVHKKPPYWKRAKRLWDNMLKRCYDPKYKRGYYGRGYTVDTRWHCFANFLEDLPGLDNFDKWLEGVDSKYPKYNLDKDLKYPCNKVYSKDCCMFVTEYQNKSEGAKNARELDKIKKMNKN